MVKHQAWTINRDAQHTSNSVMLAIFKEGRKDYAKGLDEDEESETYS